MSVLFEQLFDQDLRNFLVNLLAGLIAYFWKPNKPSLNLSDQELALLPAII